MTTNIHPHPHLSMSHLVQLHADYNLVLKRKKGNRLVFQHRPESLTGPGLARLSHALKQRAK